MPITTPPTAANSSHTDANQQFSIVGVQGTLGTADVSGTSPTMAFSGDPVTGAQYVYNLAPGTVTTGTLQNLVSGTINALASGTITGGTLTNLVSGTINALAAGTLSPLPTIANSTYGTIGTTGVTIFGTLAGGTSSGAGTEIFITSLSLTMPSTASSQDISIGWGTNAGTFHAGTGLLMRGNFPAGGGIQKTFWPPVNSGTNAQLAYFQAGAGTANISVTYFVTPSTI